MVLSVTQIPEHLAICLLAKVIFILLTVLVLEAWCSAHSFSCSANRLPVSEPSDIPLHSPVDTDCSQHPCRADGVAVERFCSPIKNTGAHDGDPQSRDNIFRAKALPDNANLVSTGTLEQTPWQIPLDPNGDQLVVKLGLFRHACGPL